MLTSVGWMSQNLAPSQQSAQIQASHWTTVHLFSILRVLKMKEVFCLLLFFLLYTIGVSSSHESDYRNTFCNFKNDGVYADPYDGCKGFIHCHNYHADYKLCPGGLLFNSKTGNCDWPGNVTCPIGVLNCEVGIVGGGISGLYMAYMLLKTKKEPQVCIFEKDPNLGGRIRDYHFKQAPDVDVGLGAWRIDKLHYIMIDLLRELGITHREWSFVEPSLIESRGVKANNHEAIKQGYPKLRAHPLFGRMSSNQLLSYACKPEHVANVDSYATVDTYFSNIITPEGAEYLSELYGYKGDYTDFISPKSYMEFTEMTLKLSDKYIRPTGGMSTIISTLKNKIEAMGGKIFTSTGIKTLFKEGTNFVLMTPKLRVNSKKLVVATPPVQFRKISGATAKRLQSTAQFDSIQPIPAFKGAAVYSNAWWEKIRVAGSRVKPGQKFISYSNCLGISMAHRGKGTKGEGVLHTMYADGACSRRWADIANLKKNFLNTEVHRALETKYGTKIPAPLDTAYQYWDSAWHFQKPGTPYTMVDISNWAKRPFAGENIFVVGEAFHPFRGWCEGSIVSSQNALREGWGIQIAGGAAARMAGRVGKDDISQLIRSKSMARA